METSTPVLVCAADAKEDTVVQDSRNRLDIMPGERFVLLVGVSGASLPANKTDFRYVIVPTVKDIQLVIGQLLNIHHRAPAAIICKAGEDIEAVLTEWKKYFASNKALLSLPFFIHPESVNENIKSVIKQFGFIDDIITDETFGLLGRKISFVNKFKQLSAFNARQLKAGYQKKRLGNIGKRSFDVLVSGLALVALSPLLIVIAAAVKLESRGPVFYAGRRAGKNYKVFKFYKFRTMVADADKQLDKLKHLNQYAADSNGPVFYKVSNDPRITRFGKFLRNTSLDEIPQLYNVLKGDMSIVGNRPLPLYEATTLVTDQCAERFLAPAGITGLWQVSKRGNKEMSAQERIDLDINYAQKYSFSMDLWLMVNTPLALIQKDNV